VVGVGTYRGRVKIGVYGALLGCALVLSATDRADARLADGCRPLRAIVYAATGSVTVAQALAATPSACAQYFVSVPPLAADKTQMRGGSAATIRGLGANFHALAEVNVSGWQSWVTSTGNSWYQAGVEARTRMAAAGFDVAAGDSWVVNELSSAVRSGTGPSRRNIRDLVHGLFDGSGGPPSKGALFVVGISQPTTSLATYKANLESWLQDAGFWADMSSYVGDFLQETYGDVREYGVAGADVPTRLAYVNAYLQHVLQLVSAGPSPVDAAHTYLAASYAPLANAAWAWSSGFGYTAVPYEQMEDYVSAQVDAMRSYETTLGWSADRIGFAWDPSNSMGLSSADFNTQTQALLARLAAAIQASADPAAPGSGACAAPWCTATVDGAAFTSAWSTFSTWAATGPAFGSSPQTVTAGVATGPMSVETQIGGVVTALPNDTVIHLSSSSAGETFSATANGPWTSTLDVAVPARSSGVTFYMLDSQPGTPTITATIGGQQTTQVEVVNAAAAPLALSGGGNTVTFAEGGPPVPVDPALTISDSQRSGLTSATATISSGLTTGDLLTANTSGTSISASYSSGTLTLSGTDSLAAYQAVLQSVSFGGSTASGGSRTILWTASDGTTTASAVSTVVYTAPPSAPTGTAATAGDGEASVSFSPPGSNGGATIRSYTVTSSPGGVSATGSGSPITVTGLANGTTYTFTVTAANSAGVGPASLSSNAVTPTGSTSPGGAGSSSGGSGGSAAAPTASQPIAVSPPAPGGGSAGSNISTTVGSVEARIVDTVSDLRVVRLAGRPAVLITVHAAKATALALTLRDARGHTVATWHRRVIAGTHRLSLILPAGARQPGKHRLRLAWPDGSLAKTLPLVFTRSELAPSR
jgi:hypothetical protein